MSLSDLFHNAPFVWFLIGVVFALLELLIPGLILIFFAFGALLTSLLCLAVDVNVALQIVIFVVISVSSLVLFRKRLKSRFFQNKKDKFQSDDDEFSGQRVTVVEEISVAKEGKVEFKGAMWTATSDCELKKGDMAEIIGKESIKLIVKPLK